MGQLRPPQPVLLVVAVFSRHGEALAWAESQLEEHFGPVALTSLTYDFIQTEYYQPSMGAGLQKRFLAFERLVGPDCLPAAKQATNRLEEELAASRRLPRPGRSISIRAS